MTYQNRPSEFVQFPNPQQLLSEKDLERYTSLKPRFWQQRRLSGDTPPFIRIGKTCVRYRWGEVLKWLEERKVNPSLIKDAFE